MKRCQITTAEYEAIKAKEAETKDKNVSRRLRVLMLRYPGSSSRDDALTEEIRQDFSAFEKALYSYDDDREKYGYASRVDVDSFVDYFILNEVASNLDAGAYSTYIYKDVDGLLRMCVWDFNNACDNYVDDQFGYSIRFSSDAICWSQAPERIKDLGKQRRRWHLGLFQILCNPRFGLVGVVSYVYFTLYELLSPFIELFGMHDHCAVYRDEYAQFALHADTLRGLCDLWRGAFSDGVFCADIYH